METNSCLELSSGHDILTADCDPHIINHYLQTLRSHRIIYQSSSKDLQPIVASINVCLNSSSAAGKLNGLLALKVLVEDCSAQLFTQAGPSWVQQLITLIKPSNATAPFFSKSCEVLSGIIRHASDFPDVSRQITGSASNLVTSLIECAKVNPSASGPILGCIKNLQTYFFGAVGPAIKHLEKFVFENLHPWNGIASQASLVNCFAMLPKAGGGGKEGVVHKEAWDTLSTKTVNTLDHLAGLLFSIVPSMKNSNKATGKTLIDLPRPKDSLDLLRKSYFYSAQFVTLSKCLSALILAPFSHYKSIRPSTFFALANKVLRSAPLASLVSNGDLESKILFAVLPDVMAATLGLLRDLVKVCREDMLLLVPEALNLIAGLSNDLRQCTNSVNGSIPFSEVRIQLYNFVSTLCSVLGSNSGAEYIAPVLIPLLVSDFLPAKTGVKLAPVSKNRPSKKQQKTATRSDAETRESLQQKSVDKMSASLAVASLTCLSNVFCSSGVFLRKSTHKNVQCILIGLCSEVQLERGVASSFGVFGSSAVRSALYSALLKVVVCSHPKWPAPIQYAIKIFQQGMGRREESDREVLDVCQNAISVCELIAHPRSATLELELPLDPEEISATKNESMKVHVVYIDNGGNGNVDVFADQNVDENGGSESDVDDEMTGGENQETMRQNQKENVGPDFQSQPGFDLLAGKVKGSAKRKIGVDHTAMMTEEEVDYAECEKLMKDVNSFENKISITIPDEVANRIIPDSVKRPKIEEKNGSSESEGGLDLETMLSSFVDKTKDD